MVGTVGRVARSWRLPEGGGLTDQGDGIAADLQGLPTVGLKVGRTARPGPAAALPLRW